MARQRSNMIKLFILIFASTVLACGCNHHSGAFQARAAFEEVNALFSQGDYQAALDRYARIAEEQPLTRDRVLFEMGIIHAHPKNEHQNYQQAIDCFQALIQDYPASPYRQNSETMIFTINNGARKDQAIAALQAKAEAIQNELKAREEVLLALQQQMAELERKYFASLLEKGSADRILIEKAERRLTLLSKGEALKTYRIALGGNPVGPKEQQGDNKTPEGIYTVDSRNRDSRYHLSLRISYPNEQDRRRARALGVAPGGDIMIHGLKDEFSQVGKAHAEVDWTRGCIAVTNEEIEEIERLTPNGTVVEIRP